ncbi:glycosyltransferase family 9 protein [Psittacicella melopsittaci]|nr:glycosyltransferase family 9 protein [Psittacicella melopsittaci]
MSKEPFDILLHAQTSLRANVLSTFIKAKLKVGFCKERSFEGHSLVVDRSIPSQTSMHVMVDYFDLFKPFFNAQDCAEFAALVTDTALLYQGNYPEKLQAQRDLQPLFDLGLGAPNSEQALANVSQHNQNLYKLLANLSRYSHDNKTRDGKLIYVNPASSALKKNWTKEGYVALIKFLIDQGHYVVVTGGKNQVELELVNGVAKEVEEYIRTAHPGYTCKALQRPGKKVFFNLAAKTNLAELYLFLSLADLVISPDSGPMHLASCLGIPTIGLFAYINPLRSGPIQGVCDVVSVFHKNTYGHDIEYSQEQYRLDLKNWRKKPPKCDDKLMLQITPAEVIERTKQVLARLDK